MRVSSGFFLQPICNFSVQFIFFITPTINLLSLPLKQQLQQWNFLHNQLVLSWKLLKFQSLEVLDVARHTQSILENKLQWTLNSLVREALKTECMFTHQILVVSPRHTMKTINRHKQMRKHHIKSAIVKTERICPKMLWFGLPF